MASHTPRFESPAKVFAKLKSKVRREEMCANDGLFTGKDPLCNVREKLGEYKSPRKRAESTWMNEVLKENQRFGSYRNEAQPLTLSPISSPQKTVGYLYSNICSSRLEEMPPVTATAHGRTLRSGAFLESTAVSQPLFLAKKQNHTEPPHIRDLDGYNVTCRTPAKTQPVENDCVGGVFQEKRAPLMSSANKRLPIRKRKWEPWGFNNVSSDGVSEPRERKTSFSEDDTQNNTRVEDLGQARGFSADPLEFNQFTHDPMCPPQRSTAKKRCIFMDKVPPMSPAKMFAYMKERESKTEQKEAHKLSSSTTELIDGGPSRPPRDTPSPSTHSMGETEDITTEGVPDSVPSASPSRVESADSQLDEDAAIPTASSQPVLLEDPLVLSTPRVSIPKKQEAVFKRNKWPQCAKFPSESVIHLQKWYLRRNRMGLFVDGIHQERNIPWNSNIIVERVSSNVVKTVSGRVYILVGKMNLCVDSVFPNWLLKKFAAGFPPDWKALYEKSLSETKDDPGGKAVSSERRGIRARTKSEASSNNLSVKQNKQKAFKTPESCPPASSSSAKVSRSGRIIKPPLEYWKGGRVTLDAHMNVTIHECYDTSICNPEVTTTVSARWSQKPARVFPLSNGGPKQCESTSDQDVAVPLRRVKAPLRKRNRARANLSEKPSPVESLTSSEERPGRRTRSSERLSNRALYAASLSQKQSEPEKPSRQRSKKQTHNTTRPSVRSSTRAVPASSKSPTVSDETSQDQDDFSIRKYKHKKRDKKSQPGQTSSSNEAEDSGMELRKRSRGAKNKEAPQAQRKRKQSKCTKTLQPAEPLPKSTQSSKKHKAHKRNTQIPQEQDEDEWTEAELLKLQEAVSFYPKHVAGYWAKVARIVGTRSAEECHNQHTSQGTSQTPAKRAREPKKKKVEVPKDSAQPVISARAGTLKRKQQVRQFLENMPRDDVEDVFRSAYMQNKRFEIPSMCPSEDQDFTLTDLEPLTPMSTGFPEVKTPQCLHITPGMMGSPMRSNDDKYVFQLQKRMKKHRFNVCKKAPSSKSFTPTPSVKRTMRRCGNTENDTFVVWEMFPGNDAASESGEEEDFYFSDDD